MGILNIGLQALQANQTALQTAGNNIANVNTPGYSRQRVVLQATPGQFTGGGYIGKGVEIQTIQRNFSEFLTRQATLAGAAQYGDVARADKLKQLEGIFEGGASGLGASINDMLNAFSDVVSAPTDLTARTVVLTRIDETAARMRATSQRLDDLQIGLSQELDQKVNAANSLAKSIAAVNTQISEAQGSGQTPNDLLDRRDQLVRELNQYIQTSSVMADDGTVGLFVGSSQALVLGSRANSLAQTNDQFGDPFNSQLTVIRDGVSIGLDASALGGGEISGLLRFQNNDLAEGRNLLGRITLSVSTSMNEQHRLGLDLDGNPGGDLFTPVTLDSRNILPPKQSAPPAPQVGLNQGTASLALAIDDVSKLAASDYLVTFTSASEFAITRKSDGLVRAFDFLTSNPVQFDGLNLSLPSGTPTIGDRFVIKPFSNSASNINREFSTPRALAVGSPVLASIAKTNTGSLQMVSLKVNGNPNGLVLPPTGTGVKLTFSAGPPPGYTVSGSAAVPEGFTAPYTPGTTVVPFTPNAAISIDGWQITLSGAPKNNDTITIGNAKDAQYGDFYSRNAGNATAMMDLRDAAMFDGAALSDGYAGLISQIGIRAQSANYSAEVSTSIAGNVEKDRAGVSGVNLDEEAAKLLQFQQAYQASAKMIQLSQSIFDSLIRSMGG